MQDGEDTELDKYDHYNGTVYGHGRGVGNPFGPKIRDYHYRVAQMIAEGKKNALIAHETGLNMYRVCDLRRVPWMQDIIAYYRKNFEEIEYRVYENVCEAVYRKAALLREHALDHLNQKYEETPELVTHSEARQDLVVTNEMLEEKVTKSVQLHGSLKDISLAKLVDMRRARAEALEQKPINGNATEK